MWARKGGLAKRACEKGEGRRTGGGSAVLQNSRVEHSACGIVSAVE